MSYNKSGCVSITLRWLTKHSFALLTFLEFRHCVLCHSVVPLVNTHLFRQRAKERKNWKIGSEQSDNGIAGINPHLNPLLVWESDNRECGSACEQAGTMHTILTGGILRKDLYGLKGTWMLLAECVEQPLRAKKTEDSDGWSCCRSPIDLRCCNCKNGWPSGGGIVTDLMDGESLGSPPWNFCILSMLTWQNAFVFVISWSLLQRCNRLLHCCWWFIRFQGPLVSGNENMRILSSSEKFVDMLEVKILINFNCSYVDHIICQWVSVEQLMLTGTISLHQSPIVFVRVNIASMAPVDFQIAMGDSYLCKINFK